MKSRQVMFFAVLDDIMPLLQNIEGTVDRNYYEMGLFDNKDIIHYNSIFDTPNIAFTLSGDRNRIDRYLVMKKGTILSIREVPQKNGGIKYAVDQSINSKSIEIRLGDMYRDAENVIVACRVATISNDDDSNELYKLFSSKIKKDFKRIGAFYVGEKAEEILRSGWRLVTNVQSPKGYKKSVNKI